MFPTKLSFLSVELGVLCLVRSLSSHMVDFYLHIWLHILSNAHMWPRLAVTSVFVFFFSSHASPRPLAQSDQVTVHDGIVIMSHGPVIKEVTRGWLIKGLSIVGRAKLLLPTTPGPSWRPLTQHTGAILLKTSCLSSVMDSGALLESNFHFLLQIVLQLFFEKSW